MDSSKNIILNS